MLERTRHTLCLAVLVAVASLSVPGIAGADRVDLAAHHTRRLVYESSRPALQVSITREGDAIILASVGAPGVCSNGEETGTGFEKKGADRWPIRSDGRFEHNYGDASYLRGRVAGDRVIGVFRESRLHEDGSEETETLCGNVTPRGRNQHFVARLVR
jgi:hypothetical protein